ncbi:hypothetical protein QQX98_006705 [Neonectria punicea]|uniref:Carrier domain-containing protein n=1 Tax=Neonectria punicea TaxID=979145 RepID=A0ABR1H0B2_9HYPO
MANAEVLTPSHSSGRDLLGHGLDTELSATAATTTTPPTYSTRTVTELMAKRAREQPTAPILGYPSSGTEYVEYNFSQLGQFSNSAASVFAKTLPIRTSSSEKAKVVALLGPSTLDYVVAVLALSKLGFVILFLSPRLAVSAYEHLLETTGCEHVVVGEALTKIADHLQARRPSVTITGFVPQSMYEKPGSWTPPTLDLNEETHQTAWIIHSSGSTGPPKPIYQTHHAALRNCENNMNMEGFITLPLYHGHGVSSIFRAFTSAKKIYMMNAALPLTMPTLVEIMRAHKFDIFYAVPYALKLLAESDEGIGALAEMPVVMFGGSACPDALGNLLVDNGVNLVSHYGCTETGQLMTSFRPANDKAWNYVRVHDRLRRAGWPSKVDTNRDDRSYATKDLFVPHQTIEGAWKYVARRDDTIVLVNGEKMIPIAMEQAVRRHPLAREAIVFGTGRSQAGLLVFASDKAANMTTETVINTVWPTVTEQNAELPGYAQLSRAMVSVLPPGTDFPRTAKATIDIIEEAYRRFENQDGGGSPVLSLPEMKAYLLGKIRALFELDEALLTDNVDLFALGVDSLQSTLLRAEILKDVDLDGSSLPQNIVFEFPTIARLANALVGIRQNRDLNQEDVTQQMESLVSKHSQWPPRVSHQTATTEPAAAVVVTGATGSLGAHLVAQLANHPNVDLVPCLVRASSDGLAMHRVIESMRRRRVYNSLPREARLKLRFHSSDLANAKLGLSDPTHDSIRASVISVMHCAWSVNFDKHLSSFEDCVVGVYNLVSLCLGATRKRPATFNFCSSVSTVSQVKGTGTTSVPSFDKAHGMGYAQSKLVCEHIVQKAVQNAGITARIIRVGQITADTVNGIWNESEAIPLLLSTVKTLRILPTLDETHRWLLVNTVARAFADISLSDSPDLVFNVVNSTAFHWTGELLPKLREAGLEFAQVDQQEWLKQLRESDPDPSVNPTIKLLDFYVSKYGDGSRRTRRAPAYDTGNAQQVSSTLRAATALAPDLIKKMVDNFLRPMWATQEKSQQNKTNLLIVSGSKSSAKAAVAADLADNLKCCWINGDSLRDAVAISKTVNGIELLSLDHLIWLSAMKLRVLESVRSAQLLGVDKPVVLTCSTLESHHRAALRDVIGDGSVQTTFVKLESPETDFAAAESSITDEQDVLPVSTNAMTANQVAGLILSVVY